MVNSIWLFILLFQIFCIFQHFHRKTMVRKWLFTKYDLGQLKGHDGSPALVYSISASTFFASSPIYLKGLSHTKMDTKPTVLVISWTVWCTNECLIHMPVRGEGRKEQESWHETPARERGREAGRDEGEEESQSSAERQTFPQWGQCCASTPSTVVDIRRIYLPDTFNTSTATKELIYGWP